MCLPPEHFPQAPLFICLCACFLFSPLDRKEESWPRVTDRKPTSKPTRKRHMISRKSRMNTDADGPLCHRFRPCFFNMWELLKEFPFLFLPHGSFFFCPPILSTSSNLLNRSTVTDLSLFYPSAHCSVFFVTFIGELLRQTNSRPSAASPRSVCFVNRGDSEATVDVMRCWSLDR